LVQPRFGADRRETSILRAFEWWARQGLNL
jgi:hypothetical protein